jgi:hypothetical protein
MQPRNPKVHACTTEIRHRVCPWFRNGIKLARQVAATSAMQRVTNREMHPGGNVQVGLSSSHLQLTDLKADTLRVHGFSRRPSGFGEVLRLSLFYGGGLTENIVSIAWSHNTQKVNFLTFRVDIAHHLGSSFRNPDDGFL